jgi:hypothetical protein
MSDIADVTTIRHLNDQLRQSLAGGVLVMTAGVVPSAHACQLTILQAVAAVRHLRRGATTHTASTTFGALEVEGERLFWKIDYYDRSLSAHSPDPADPSVTMRVLTIMLADEY